MERMNRSWLRTYSGFIDVLDITLTCDIRDESICSIGHTTSL